MAAALGRPFLPWQSELADLAGERDSSGRYAYGRVVVSVPRRAGKTVVLLATAMHRAEQSDGARAWYTAQTRTAAGEQFVLGWIPLVERSPLRNAYKPRRSNGSEAIVRRVRRGGRVVDAGRIGVFAPNEDGLHGQDTDLGMIDEAWAHDLAAGDAIMAGLGPTQATRPNPQTWIVSAGGTEASLWWDRELAAAEEHCAAGGRSGVLLVDYGAELDDDRDDPAVWGRAHPAVGYTIDAGFLAGELAAHGPAYFDRHYLNRWPRPSGAAGTHAVDPQLWAAALDVRAELAGPVHVAYDVAPDRTRASLAAASRLPGGRVLVTVLASRTGSSWIPDRVKALRPARIVADSLTGDYTAALLSRRGRAVELQTSLGVARAAAVFVDLLQAGELRHHGQTALDDALTVAQTRTFGDAWAWSRSRSTGDITALVAATLAAWSAATAPVGRASVSSAAG
jgi:hypothetical protein